MTPLERAARALYQREPQATDVFSRDCADPGSAPVYSQREAPWEALGPEDRAPYVEACRAVLTAIREPSEGMREAAFKIEDDFQRSNGTGWDRGSNDGQHIWPAMIDAALAEEG